MQPKKKKKQYKNIVFFIRFLWLLILQTFFFRTTKFYLFAFFDIFVVFVVSIRRLSFSSRMSKNMIKYFLEKWNN